MLHRLLAPGLELRPLVAADAAAFHEVIVRNRVHLDRWLRWSSGIRSRAEAEEFLRQAEDRLERRDGFHLGLWSEGALLGGTVCWYIQRHHRNAEVGYWLDAGQTGRGLASRSAAAAIEHLISEEDVHRIEMQCAVDNTTSRKIPERLGFRLEGIRRESHWITTRFLDHAVYGLLAREWRSPLAEAAEGPQL